jgi:hypothetical protein
MERKKKGQEEEVERVFKGAGKRERQNPWDLEHDYHQDSRPGTAKQVYSVHYYRLVHKELEGKARGERTCERERRQTSFGVEHRAE